MKKLLLLTVLIVTAAASAGYTLNLFDNIVHGTLYNYGLRFDYAWANPYWTTLRIAQVLISLTAVFSIISFFYVYRMSAHTKPHETLTKREKNLASSSAEAPEAPTESQRVGSLVKCTHCQKVFAQPLRMLDFHSERPRIVNICPFCNEVIPPVLRQEETEKAKKFSFKVKKNNQTKEAPQKEEQQKEEPQETVKAPA